MQHMQHYATLFDPAKTEVRSRCKVVLCNIALSHSLTVPGDAPAVSFFNITYFAGPHLLGRSVIDS